MSLKDIFIIKEDGVKPKTSTSFPSNPAPSFPSNPAPSFPNNSSVGFSNSPEPSFPNNSEPMAHVATNKENPFLEKILDVYDKGFEKLNQPGYDFFEYYKAVVKAGVNNPQVYVMAFDMAQSMDSGVTSTSLMSQADYYAGEIEKVYNDFKNSGKSKVQELTQKKTDESNFLTHEISSLKQQLAQIQVQISLKESALSDIDHRYQPEIDEVTQKLAANDFVKNKFVTSINLVKMNINNNLK